jgi:2-polyprenyl-3-methyl-5-hydroxy-6-metoxy-1,4-benzoquinol methylase
MRYRVKGVEIRTENAAKPYSQRSQAVVAYLKTAPRVNTVLDYGCGKLRYSDLLARIGKRATFVDSELQLTRRQRIRGKVTTVTELVAERYSNIEVMSAETAMLDQSSYDFVTCINVLSAIPTMAAIDAVLRAIKRLTKHSGVAVFINQHRNSYFKRFEVGKRHLFGHLHEGKRGYSYYGVMTKEVVQSLLLEYGYVIRRAWDQREINFVEAYPAHARRCQRGIASTNR